MSLILSHPPTLLGQCPKFDQIYFLMASLSPSALCLSQVWSNILQHESGIGNLEQFGIFCLKEQEKLCEVTHFILTIVRGILYKTIE